LPSESLRLTRDGDSQTTEKKHLRGLLCGYSPAEMAEKLYKNSRGVEADLCSTIYRYVEQLTKKPLNTLKNWRDIPEWLEQNWIQNTSI
jgi:hypothetical protein